MMTHDDSQALVTKAVAKAKNASALQHSNQTIPESGHSSAPYGHGPNPKDANPSGSPGTGSMGSEYGGMSAGGKSRAKTSGMSYAKKDGMKYGSPKSKY